MMRTEFPWLDQVERRTSGFVLCPTFEAVLLDDGRLLLVPSRGEPIQVDAPWGREVHAHVIAGDARRRPLSLAGRETLADTLRALAARGILVPATRLEAADEPRYERQVAWFDGPELDGVHAQRRLAVSTVLVLGLDGFGVGVADLLSRSGIGTLVLADERRIEPDHLTRDHLYVRDDVGVRRAVAAARHLELVNDHTRLVQLESPIDSAMTLARAMRRYRPDLLLVASPRRDSATLEWLDAAAFASGVPVLQGGTRARQATIGPMLVADVTPCHACYRAATEPADSRAASATSTSVAWTDAAAASLACAQVIAQLTGAEMPSVLGRELRLDATRLEPSWIEPARLREPCRRPGCTR